MINEITATRGDRERERANMQTWTDSDGYTVEVDGDSGFITHNGISKKFGVGPISELPECAIPMIRSKGANPENYIWVCGQPIRRGARSLLESASELQRARYAAESRDKNLARRTSAIARGAREQDGWVLVDCEIVRSSDNLMESIWINAAGESRITHNSTH